MANSQFFTFAIKTLQMFLRIFRVVLIEFSSKFFYYQGLFNSWFTPGTDKNVDLYSSVAWASLYILKTILCKNRISYFCALILEYFFFFLHLFRIFFLQAKFCKTKLKFGSHYVLFNQSMISQSGDFNNW